MAFPASPSNNQVHKEGDRSFVYDSALGVWDRVSTTDTMLGDVPQGSNEYFEGKLTNNTSFPGGHIIQIVARHDHVRKDTDTSSASFQDTGEYVYIRPKMLRSKILLLFNPCFKITVTSGGGGTVRCNVYRSGSSVTNQYCYGMTTGSDHTLAHQYMEAAPRTWNAQEVSQRFIQFLDEPNHTNITDYIQYAIYIRHAGGHSCQMSASVEHFCGLTCMEVTPND